MTRKFRQAKPPVPPRFRRCLLLLAVSSIGFAQTGVFQTANPHYPNRNPFYF
jgi:hypothetical protein